MRSIGNFSRCSEILKNIQAGRVTWFRVILTCRILEAKPVETLRHFSTSFGPHGCQGIRNALMLRRHVTLSPSAHTGMVGFGV